MSFMKWLGLGAFLSCTACIASPPDDIHTSIPFELVDGLVYVQTSVNGSAPQPFVLDTGASYSVLSPEIAKTLNVRTTVSLHADGPGRGGQTNMDLADGIDFRVGDTTLKKRKIAVLSVDYISRQANHPTAGILSVHDFAGYAIQVDYATKTIHLFHSKTFLPSKTAKVVSIELEDNVPFVRADIVLPNGTVFPGRFVLDSGLVGTLILSKPFQNRHPEFLAIEGRFDLPTVEAVGGNMKLQAAYLPALRIGAVVVDKPLAIFSVDGVGVLGNPRIDGIIGNEVLKQFLVTYDYAHNRVFLAPPSTEPAPPVR